MLDGNVGRIGMGELGGGMGMTYGTNSSSSASSSSVDTSSRSSLSFFKERCWLVLFSSMIDHT